MCVDVFGILPSYLENLESENIVRSSIARIKTALGMLKLWLSYFAGIFFKALGIRFSKEARKRDAWVFSACLSIW